MRSNHEMARFSIRAAGAAGSIAVLACAWPAFAAPAATSSHIMVDQFGYRRNG